MTFVQTPFRLNNNKKNPKTNGGRFPYPRFGACGMPRCPFRSAWETHPHPAPRAGSQPAACTCPRPRNGGRERGKEGGSRPPAGAAGSAAAAGSRPPGRGGVAPALRQLRRDGAGQERPGGAAVSSAGRSVHRSPDGLPTPYPAGQPPRDAPRPARARTSLARIRWLFSSVQRSEKTLLWRRNSKALTTIQQAAQRRRSTRVHRRQILSRSRFKPGMPLIVAPGLRSGRRFSRCGPERTAAAAGDAALPTSHVCPAPRRRPSPNARRLPPAPPPGTGPAPASAAAAPPSRAGAALTEPGEPLLNLSHVVPPAFVCSPLCQAAPAVTWRLLPAAPPPSRLEFPTGE